MTQEALGLSVGELQLTLDAKVYRQGELITGTVQLNLKEPAPAKRLVIGLMARQRAVGRSPNQGGLALSYRNDQVWDFHLQVDGPRRYRPGETARFELLIPLEASATNFSPLGDVAQALSYLSNVKRFPLEWKVYAFLDRPWQINPRGEVQVQLAPAEVKPPPPLRKRSPKKPPAAKKQQKATVKRRR